MQQRDDRSHFQRAQHKYDEQHVRGGYVRGAGAGYERVRVCYVDVQLGFNSGLWLGSGVGEGGTRGWMGRGRGRE